MRNLSSYAMSVYHRPTNQQASVHQRSFSGALWWQHIVPLLLLTWLCFVMVPLSEAVGYSYTRFVGPVRGPEIEFVTDDPITGSQHLDYIAKPEYEFSYGVEDAEARILHNRNEVRDGDEVKGVYSLVDPDGTLRIVKYTADGINGFQAEVITNGLSTLHGHHHPLNGLPSQSSSSAATGSITTPTPYQPGGFRPSLPTFVSPSYVYQKQQQLLQQQQSQIPGIITTKLTPPGSDLQPPYQYNQHGTAGVPVANNNNNNNDAKDQKPNYKVHESQEEGTNETEGDDSEADDDDEDDSHEEADKEDKKKNYQDTEEEEDDDDYEEEVEDYEEKVKKTHATYDESDEDYYRK